MRQQDDIMTDTHTKADKLVAYMMAGEARSESKSRRAKTDVNTMTVQLDRIARADFLDRSGMDSPFVCDSSGNEIGRDKFLEILRDVPTKYHDGKRWRPVKVPYHLGVVGIYPPYSNLIKLEGLDLLQDIVWWLPKVYEKSTGNRYLASVIHSDEGEAIHLHLIGSAYWSQTRYNPKGNKLPTLPDASLSTIRMVYHRAVPADRAHGSHMVLLDKMDQDNKRPWNLEIAWWMDQEMRKIFRKNQLENLMKSLLKNHKEWVQKTLLQSEQYYRLENTALRRVLADRQPQSIMRTLSTSQAPKIEPIDSELIRHIRDVTGSNKGGNFDAEPSPLEVAM